MIEEVELGFVFSFALCSDNIIETFNSHGTVAQLVLYIQFHTTVYVTLAYLRFNETTRLVFIFPTRVDQLAFGPVPQPNHFAVLRACHWGDPANLFMTYILV